jgi:hypothetical protein
MRIASTRGALGRAVFLLAFTLAGCTALRVDWLTCPVGKDCRFPGVSPSAGDHRKTALLLVHGMGNPAEGWSGELVAKVTREAGFAPTTERPVHHEIRRSPGTFLYGTFDSTFYASPAGQRLEVHELTWSPTTQPVKASVLGFDAAAALTRDRVAVNRSLKQQLINDRLSDPVLYVGAYKAEMQYPVQQAICWILKDGSAAGACSFEGIDPAAIRGTRVDIVTLSLGSRMVFDTLADLHDSPKPAAAHQALADLISNLESVYMLANQLPLLELGNVKRAPGAIAPMAAEEAVEIPQGLERILQLRSQGASPRRPEEAATPAPIWLIAFSDPNDLLSYTIPEAFARRNPGHRFANVSISVARTAILGLLANPLTAHTGHDQVQRIIQLIAHGSGNEPRGVR